MKTLTLFGRPISIGLPTYVIAIISIAGAVLVVIGAHDPHPELTFHEYIRDIGLAWGLLGIGHGIDSYSSP